MSEPNKIEKVQSSLSFAKNAFSTGKDLYQKYQSKKNFTVIIEDKSFLYEEVHHWLINNSPRKAKAIQLELGERWIEEISDYDYSVKSIVHDKTETTIVIDGHRIKVKVQVPSLTGANENNVVVMNRSFNDSLVFTSTTKEGQVAVENLVRELLEKRQKSSKKVYVYSVHTGRWNRSSELIERPLESVFIPKEQKERIVSDIENFRASEAKYLKFGMPWHRGHLYYGPPGSGKTSIARALASEFKLNLYTISLSETKDTGLISLIQNIAANSVLLLEDIDVFTAATSRHEAKDEITLSGLLNALDGVATPHGLIVIMTTNFKDNLDDALIRAGRVDLNEYFGPVVEEQVKEAFNYLYGTPLTSQLKLDNVSMAEVIEVLKRNMDDPVAAQRELVNNYG